VADIADVTAELAAVWPALAAALARDTAAAAGGARATPVVLLCDACAIWERAGNSVVWIRTLAGEADSRA